MPTGVYLSNGTLQKLNGDLFEQDARGLIGDHFEQQASAQLPDMVRQAQQDEDQRQQAIDQQRRDAMADNFMASVPDALAQHLGNAAPPESPQNSPSVIPPSEPTQTPTTDLNAVPAPPPQDVTPTAPALPVPNAPAPTLPSTATPAVHPINAAPATQTTAGLSGGGDLSGRVGARGQQIMSSASSSASWLGDDGVKALQAVLLTEGGLAGARGDQGRSAGPLQFFEGGQLANFAQQHGLTLDAAKTEVEQNPEAAVAWAIGTPDAPGYLGRAIQAGQQAGLKGADLATYAQQHGQVSVSPERAGANFNALFGGGQSVITGAQAAASSPQDILAKAQPFLGSSYVWGGKSPNQGFDCSGLAGYLTTGQAESTGSLYGKSSTVGADQAQPGDLVFWNMGSNDPHLQHVGVYLGNGQVVQSGGDQAKVNIGSVNQSIGSPPEFRRVGPGGAPAQAVAAQQQNVPPDQSAAASPAGQSPGLFDKLQQLGPAIGKAIGDLFGGGSGQTLTHTTATPDPTLASAAWSAAGLDNPAAVVGAGLGAPTSGDILTQQRNEVIAQNNPLRDVPGVGGASTFLGQAALDPTNLLLAGEPGVARAVGEGAGAVAGMAAETFADPAVQAFLRARQAGEATTGFASGFDALVAARNAVSDLQSRFPQMSPGSVAASGAGRQLAEIEADAAANPSLYSPKPPATTLEPEVAATLPPGSGPLAAAAEPMESDATLQGLRNMVTARKTGEAPAPAADLLGLKTEAPTSTAPTTSAPAAASVNAGPVPATPLSLKLAVTGGGGTPPPPGPLVQTALPGIPPPTPGTASLADVFRAYHTGNVVSGLATLTHVAVNSILAPAWSFVTRGAADVAGLNFDRLAGSGIGAGAGLADSGRAIAQAFSDHFSNPDAIFNKTLPGALNSGVAKLFLKAQAIPTSLHAVGQSFAQNAIMKMEVGRLAGEAATDQGLKGQAWSNFVSNTVANPTGAMAQQAEALAKRAALRGDPGTVGQVMGKIASVPYFGNTLFPVVRIASNALSQGIEKSPLGLLGTGLDVARAAIGHEGPYAGPAGFAGNGIVAPLQERLTNNLAGSALTAWLASKALDGSITGDGPGDPGQKAELMAQGWQPNSVYVPGRGYVDYHMFGSLADSFALAGSYGDAVKYSGNKGGTTDDPGTIAESMFKQMGKYLEDATGMRTIGQLYDIFHTQGVGLNQAAKAAAQFGSSLTGGFVPFSALDRNIASATDPYARRAVAEAGDLPSLFGQDLSMGIPGLREQNVPIKQNILGQPEANNQAGLGVFSPRTGTGTPDPVIKAVEDAGVRFPALPKQVSVSSKYAIDLTPQEQQQFQTLRGQLVQQMLGELVADPDFAAAPLASRQKWVQLAFARADKAASQQLVSQVPDSDLVDRAMANQERRAPVAFASP